MKGRGGGGGGRKAEYPEKTPGDEIQTCFSLKKIYLCFYAHPSAVGPEDSQSVSGVQQWAQKTVSLSVVFSSGPRRQAVSQWCLAVGPEDSQSVSGV